MVQSHLCITVESWQLNALWSSAGLLRDDNPERIADIFFKNLDSMVDLLEAYSVRD